MWRSPVSMVNMDRLSIPSSSCCVLNLEGQVEFQLSVWVHLKTWFRF